MNSGIESIKIKNLLSFDDLIVPNLQDINCIVGKNNTGKSNLLKLISFYYKKLENQKVLPPSLNSNYSTFGTITIVYNVKHIKNIVTSNKTKGYFLKHVYQVLFDNDNTQKLTFWDKILKQNQQATFELTLKVYSNEATEWSIKDPDILKIINYLYPFFEIDTRHIDLYDWDKLWHLISRLKSFNVNQLKKEEVVQFFNEKLSDSYRTYEDYVQKVEDITNVKKYSYREKVLSYVKAGLNGHTFNVHDEELSIQSDGTNSHEFIKLFLSLLISLTRREFITPMVYIDEAEIGLHPKLNEELIDNLYTIYQSFLDIYKTPYPKIIFSTHSPNVVKQIIKLFEKKQQILHFSKDKKNNTKIQKMNSQYKDQRFLNIFSDNEARLFFSDFILFVEGETEIELFNNNKLKNKFLKMKQVDVYKTNSVALKYLNPSYANSSIPFLVLYDADKLIQFDFTSKKITFITKNINLNSFKLAYQRAYFGSKQFTLLEYLKVLFDWKQFECKLVFQNFTYITNLKYNLFVKYINNTFLNYNNFFITKTTIEEVLINKESLHLFLAWLEVEYKESLQIQQLDKGDINKVIASMMTKYSTNSSIREIFTKIFSVENHYEGIIQKRQKLFAERIKKKNLILIKKAIKRFSIENQELLTLFLLVFNGKTETLISVENKNYNMLDSSYRSKLKDIQENHLYPLAHLFSKTSGWATKFLNFAIEEIDKTIDEEDLNLRNLKFRKKFKLIFEEFYDIIAIIERKL